MSKGQRYVGEVTTVEEALKVVIEECPDSGYGVYAKTYARAVGQAREEYGEEGVRVQVLYVLNNLGYWRGPRARQVKAVLRGYVAETRRHGSGAIRG